MEFCMEGALKPSLRRELSFLKQNQQVIFDDINSCGVVSNNNEDFSVDDLLDFSNGDFEEEEEEEEEEEDGSVDDKDSFSSRDLVDADADADADADVDDDNNSNSGSLSSDQSLLTNELVEPIDDYAELEWVSQFVDDSSCSELSLLYPNARSEPDKKPVFHKTTSTTTPCLPLRVPSKARTKRTRPSGRVWSFGSPLSPESRTVSTSSSTTTTPGLILTNAVQAIEWFTGGFDEPVSKKPKKKMAVQGGGLFLRRCSHCQTQKTPQWRTGPLGPKTLCNACGVRFKSGRLFPEYRPACSPTFSVDVHSNSHRKVLEMRQKKESSGPEVGLNQMIHSF